MELDFALLANSVERFADGRLAVWGTGFDGVGVTEFPAVFQCTLCARLFLSPDEELAGHTFRVELVEPNGERTIQTETQINTVRNDRRPDMASVALILANLAMQISAEGEHALRLVVDGRELKRIPFLVFRGAEQAR